MTGADSDCSELMSKCRESLSQKKKKVSEEGQEEAGKMEEGQKRGRQVGEAGESQSPEQV